ncbi:2-oxoglutarate-dependent dioxygenase AOP2 [Prunus yedoensis var. nudiflora]|uniref:2-oxoglutarate-dependent dioxygenase AOP2 n=1 Tax=Prunus yedoensis var. nudiflora TaxID=2094558 RepID=A0A314XZG4_PRUYE|nr:2-oxoglutarate-dependent dioxygenase AOP2 [Prunus yedoensis var. nudiflora]
MEELDQVVTRMVFENYGVEKYHDDHIQSIVQRTDLINTKNSTKTGIDEGLPAHTDKTFSTILYQNHVKGLEIYSKDNEWIGVEPLPSSFIFLAVLEPEYRPTKLDKLSSEHEKG